MTDSFLVVFDASALLAFLHREAVWIIAASYAVCAALRLARFNVETGDDDSHLYFTGLPSPAAARKARYGVTYGRISKWFLKSSAGRSRYYTVEETDESHLGTHPAHMNIITGARNIKKNFDLIEKYYFSMF